MNLSEKIKHLREVEGELRGLNQTNDTNGSC